MKRSDLEHFIDECCDGDPDAWYWVNETTASTYDGRNFSIGNFPNFEKLKELPVWFRKAGGKFSIGGTVIDSLERCPTEVAGTFVCSMTRIKSLRNMPKSMSEFYALNCPFLTPYETRYALLSAIRGFIGVINGDISEILWAGRDKNGVMPSELIPGKIAQLKAWS